MRSIIPPIMASECPLWAKCQATITGFVEVGLTKDNKPLYAPVCEGGRTGRCTGPDAGQLSEQGVIEARANGSTPRTPRTVSIGDGFGLLAGGGKVIRDPNLRGKQRASFSGPKKAEKKAWWDIKRNPLSTRR